MKEYILQKLLLFLKIQYINKMSLHLQSLTDVVCKIDNFFSFSNNYCNSDQVFLQQNHIIPSIGKNIIA